MLHFNEPLVGTKEAENINFNETIKALYEYNYHFSQEKRTVLKFLLIKILTFHSGKKFY